MEDLSFFERAELEAEIAVREWIRKTLRETFLQGMKRHLTLQADGNVRLDNLVGCLTLVQRLSDAWQGQLRKHQHGRTAQWVDDVHARGKQDLWSIPVTPLVLPTIATVTTTTTTTNDETEDNTQKRMVQEKGSIVETPAPATPKFEGPLIPYCELRYLVRPHLKQPNPLLAAEDPITLFKQLGKQGVSYWPLDPAVIDDMVAEISKRQRADRIATKDIEVEFMVPTVNEGQEENDTADPGEDEESKRLFSQALARSKGKIRVPRLGRKRKMEAYRQATIVRDIPRRASPIGSATYHVQSSLTVSEKEDALRYITSDVDTTDTAGMVSIFGPLQELGRINRLMQEKKGKRGTNAALTESQQRRRDMFFAKERIFPRRAQKNNDPGKYKSKIVRTEQDMGDGILNSYLEFDLGRTILEYTDKAGEKRLMLFSGLQVVLQESS